MGQSEVPDGKSFRRSEEWHVGVLRADKPALSAICRGGFEGRLRRLLCVVTNVVAR